MSMCCIVWKIRVKSRISKKYLLAALFNAPSAIDGYYRAEVNVTYRSWRMEDEYRYLKVAEKNYCGPL